MMARRRCSAPSPTMAALLAFFAVFADASRSQAHIEVNVTRIGFPTIHSGDVVRSGAWTPIVVDVALVNQPVFDGFVRLAQFDTDGDAAFDELEVHIRAETGGSQRVTLYALPNFQKGQGKFDVELQTMARETVEVVCQGELTRRARAAQPSQLISDDDLVILSVGTGTMGRLADLVNVNIGGAFRRPLHVGHISPTELPEHWIGLESVDVIRWENANVNELTEKQLTALLDWVREGGTLLIMSAPADGSFAAKKVLDAVMPTDLGQVITLTRLEDKVYDRLLWSDDQDPTHEGFTPPVSALRCAHRKDSSVIARDDTANTDLITARVEGRGRIVFAGLTEKNLFQGNGSAVAFYRRIFRLARAEDNRQDRPEALALYPYVLSAVSFYRSGGMYLGLAALFSVAYVLVATLGSWTFLTSRGWRRHSWTMFGAVAALATFLSIVGVNWVRGIGDHLHQITVIDAEAGQNVGRASIFFGIKTSTDKLLDLWLPSDPVAMSEPRATPCYLRPIPTGAAIGDDSGSFVDPQEYQLRPTTAVLENVRLRATLKQIEGRWQGRLGGKVTGQITIKGSSGNLVNWLMTDDSYIVNELGVELQDCYLLQPMVDVFAPASQPGQFEDDLLRDARMYAFPIGNLPANGNRVLLADLCHKAPPSQKTFQFSRDWQLEAAQKRWGAAFRITLDAFRSSASDSGGSTLGNEQNALLLASTLGELAVERPSELFSARTWSRSLLRPLDLRERLQRDCVILVGFAEGPGPVRLHRRQGDRLFMPLEPDPQKSWTMYRIRIPVTLIATAEPVDNGAADGDSTNGG
ncbi:MAG: hypothetical protein AABZ47_15140 [Planctomycetota bacterium]